MARGLVFTALLLAICALAPRSAEAGIPIPCTGEHVVLVKKLPREARIKTEQGLVHIDLGYKFSGCTDGKWVGYLGEGRRYYDVPEPVLELFAIRAGLNGLPSEPSYLFTLSASWPAWLWTGIFGIAALGTLGKARASIPGGSSNAILTDVAAADASAAQPALQTPPGPTSPVIADGRPAFGRRVRAV